MGTELVTAQPNGVVQGERAVTVVDLIRELATNDRVSVEKLAGLVALQERAEAREAEKLFNGAYARLQMKMPRVKKNGKISLRTKDGQDKGEIPFSTWEDIDAVIRPLLCAEGFALSFSNDPTPNGVLMTGRLTHISGHSIKSTMQLPPDPGPGRNALQAIGSSRSYGKRYISFDLLNIVCEGADRDGKGAFPLTADQLNNVRNMVDACELKGGALKAFLNFAGATSVETIQQRRYEDVMQALNTKLRKIQEGA